MKREYQTRHPDPHDSPVSLIVILSLKNTFVCTDRDRSVSLRGGSY